jgi:hypothetical protein
LHGLRWPLQPPDKLDWIKDIKEAFNFGKHKGTVQQNDLLQKLMTDNVIQGLALPLPCYKITSILGVLISPLNIQAQNTIKERGKIIPMN